MQDVSVNCDKMYADISDPLAEGVAFMYNCNVDASGFDVVGCA